VRENIAAVEIGLTAEDLAQIDADFPPPKARTPLGML
jgi:aryl-alcohol dehydrogenase-like predicted oxidoreductase